MRKDHDQSAALPKAAVVQELPARIINGRCSNCNFDLSALAEKIMAESDQREFHCTGCGIRLRTDEIGLEFWKCEACETPLIEFGKDTHCHGCGKELIYPEGATTRE